MIRMMNPRRDAGVSVFQSLKSPKARYVLLGAAVVVAIIAFAITKPGVFKGGERPEDAGEASSEPALQERLPGEQPASSTTKTVVSHLVPGKLPAGLPPDFPIDPNGELILNEVRTFETGTTQAQISFVTPFGVQYVFKGYKDYLKGAKWWMGTVDQDDESPKSLTASKESLVITIVVQSVDNGRTKVDIVLADHGASANADKPR